MTPRRDRRAIALLIVMGLTVLIATMAMSFHDQMALRLAEAKMAALDAQAMALARSGVTLGRLLLKLDNRPYQWFHQDEGGGAVGDDSESEAKAGSEMLDKVYQLLASTRRDGLPLEGGQLALDLVDENARVNVNKVTVAHLTALFQNVGVKRIKKLELYGENVEEDISREAAASVLNWRGWRQAGGADDPYYQGLKPPYQMRMQPYESPEELMLVKDITPLTFYGTPDEPPAVEKDPAEAQDKSADKDKAVAGGEGRKKVQGIGPLLTVWGDGKINANNATRAVLKVVPGLMESPSREQVVDQLIKKRPFRSAGELQAVVGLAGPQLGGAAGAMLKVSTDVVRVRATGILGLRRRTVTAVLSRKNRQLRTLFYREE